LVRNGGIVAVCHRRCSAFRFVELHEKGNPCRGPLAIGITGQIVCMAVCPAIPQEAFQGSITTAVPTSMFGQIACRRGYARRKFQNSGLLHDTRPCTDLRQALGICN
jgi:hypothetical protein